MASDKTKPKAKSYIFHCKSLPIAPGTKTRARLPRDGDAEPLLPASTWRLLGTATAALIVGVLIGRFLL